jgi:hypothetical protein
VDKLGMYEYFRSGHQKTLEPMIATTCRMTLGYEMCLGLNLKSRYLTPAKSSRPPSARNAASHSNAPLHTPIHTLDRNKQWRLSHPHMWLSQTHPPPLQHLRCPPPLLPANPKPPNQNPKASHTFSTNPRSATRLTQFSTSLSCPLQIQLHNPSTQSTSPNSSHPL